MHIAHKFHFKKNFKVMFFNINFNTMKFFVVTIIKEIKTKKLQKC